MNICYAGKLKNHYHIWLKNTVLTILTLGIYRFWGKTNLRSYIWSHLEIFGHPLIYNGTPLELLRAFIKALPLFLVFMLAQHGLELVHIGYGAGVSVLSLVWIVSFIFYSKHQYMYSRTTWKGIRFGLGGSRVGFANLSFILFVKSLFTLGLKDHIYVIQQNKFLCENVFWGDVPLTFTGESEDLKKMNYITWLLIIPTLFISRIYFSVYCSRYVLNHQFLQGVKLKVNYTIWQYIRFHLANFFLVFLSLGLASPYIAFRNLMFYQKYWDLEGDPDHLLAEQSIDETTGQDGASALFDISDF